MVGKGKKKARESLSSSRVLAKRGSPAYKTSAKRGRKLKVLFVAAEVAPFSSVGGLSQVMYFLPRALLALGVDVRVFTPKYGTLDEKKYELAMERKSLRVPTGNNHEGSKELICNVKRYRGDRREPMVYFLENMEYYEKRSNVYGYSDDHIRFGLLGRGVLEWLRKSKWVPDVVHVNDWHTGYLVNDLRTRYAEERRLKKIATLLSIHNLHQGSFDFTAASDLEFDDGKGELAGFFSEQFWKQNGLKRGIIYADVISTVSETYSREILSEKFGGSLHKLLKEVRTKIYGILNGLDYDDFDPRTDKLIKQNFSLKTLENRGENKVDLQREFGLLADKRIPILALVGRLDGQKGLDLVMEVMPYLLEEYQVQLVVMGGGDPQFKDFFEKLERKFPKRVGTHLMPNFTLPRRIFAGTDILLLPSKWEPGGIVAIEGMRYGAVPLVRRTGGLADIVVDFDRESNTGTGFVFKQFYNLAFMGAVVRALEAYKQAKIWRQLVRRVMKEDFSWQKAADKYLDIYRRIVDFRREQLRENPNQAYQVTY